MQIIYIDSLFLLNTVVNYLLLLSAGRLTGEILCRWRIALGAAVGGVYAAAIFFPNTAFLLHPLVKIAMGVLMMLVAYGGSGRLLRVSLVFFGVAAAFGGGIFAIELLGGQGLSLSNGIFYSNMDLRLILLSAAGCYVVLTMVFQRTAKHTPVGRELLPAVLTLGEGQVTLTALVDTGNTLTDPHTNRPVMVAEGEKLAALLPEGAGLSAQQLRNPIATMVGITHHQLKGRCRLLPYQAVGVECGMLLALRLDKVTVGGEDYGSILVALSPTRVSDGGGYCALIGV